MSQQQISELNTYVKTYLAPSPIHGIGVFAIRDIREGDKLYTDMVPKVFHLSMTEMNRLYPEIKKYLLERWPLITQGSAFAYPDTRIVAHMNHAKEPNYDAIKDRTLRAIKKGEEITEDYTQIAGWEVVHPWLVV